MTERRGSLNYGPSYGILLDMVCDRNLRIPKEVNSVTYASAIKRRYIYQYRGQRPILVEARANPEIKMSSTDACS